MGFWERGNQVRGSSGRDKGDEQWEKERWRSSHVAKRGRKEKKKSTVDWSTVNH